MRRPRQPIAVAVVASLLFGVVCAGCGGEEKPPPRPANWVTTNSLPAEFPKDVPVYPNAKVETVVAGKGAVVVWRAPDRLPVVQRNLTKQMNDQGWHVTNMPGVSAPWMGDGGLTLVGTGWGRRVSLTLGEDGDETLITVVWHNTK
jgi:hypothetical protein